MEYKLESEPDSAYKPATDNETTGLTTGNYVVRVAAVGNVPPSAVTLVTVQESSVAPPDRKNLSLR